MVSIVTGKYTLNHIGIDRMSKDEIPNIHPRPVPTFKGAHGQTLTAEDLPSPNTRWTVQRKCELMNAISAGVITQEDALVRYTLSEEELLSWKKLDAAHGPAALRSTRIQQYRSNQMVG